MTQSQITAERAELAMKESVINYDIGVLDAQLLKIERERNSLSAKKTGLVLRRAQLLRLENEMRRAGEWEG